MKSQARIGLRAIVVLIAIAALALDADAQPSVVDLAAKAVKSMEEVVPDENAAIALWQIGDRTGSGNVERLVDQLELRIIKSKRFRLIDRQKLDLILKEQKFTHSGLVDPTTMKQIGQVSGVRAFLYGKIVDVSTPAGGGADDFRTTAVLKLVSTKTSHVVWAGKITGFTGEAARRTDEEPQPPPATKYDTFARTLVKELDEQMADRDRSTVFDFWQLEKQPDQFFDPESFLDAMVVELAGSKVSPKN